MLVLVLVFCCTSNGYGELGFSFEQLTLIIFEFSDSKVLTCIWNSWQVLCVLLMWLAKTTQIVLSLCFALFVYACVSMHVLKCKIFYLFFLSLH